jgi:subtilisin-like proprotein convertase family protein
VPAANTNLAVFNGANPNGIWSLYVYDDTQGNNGVISGGWSLGLTAVSPLNTALANTEPPSWTNIVVSAGGLFQATLDGFAGQNYAIQTSSNLVSWTAVSTNTGAFIFTDTVTNASQRFYRAVQLPP